MQCSVRELLERFDSLELGQWRAFEKAHGPIGKEYSEGTLAAMMDQLQLIAYLVGAQYGEDSPVDPPQHYPRPNEMFPRVVIEDVKTEPDHQGEAVGGAEALNAYFDNL